MLNPNKNYKKGQLITYKHDLYRIGLVRTFNYSRIKIILFVKGIGQASAKHKIIRL